MKPISIDGHLIGPGYPVYIVAEMSANHNHNYDDAVRIIRAAKDAGVDAVKLQTYTPDTITIDSDKECFQIKGTIWDGRNLHELYQEAYTPWDWQPTLKRVAQDLGLSLFSSPFDFSAVDFLEAMSVPAYKIASFELVDLPLIERVARTGKPIIMSTGMATFAEIEEAMAAAKQAGATQIALLKCTSAYPSPPEEMHLRTIPHLAETFEVPTGLSDHTLGIAVPVAAVAVGASIIEKHITLNRSVRGPDSEFSLEPAEFKTLVEAVRVAEKSLGGISYEITEKEKASRAFRRSLFAVKDIQAGELFTNDNVRSIRPGHGLAPKYLSQVLTHTAARDIERGTPLSWAMIGK